MLYDLPYILVGNCNMKLWVCDTFPSSPKSHMKAVCLHYFLHFPSYFPQIFPRIFVAVHQVFLLSSLFTHILGAWYLKVRDPKTRSVTVGDRCPDISNCVFSYHSRLSDAYFKSGRKKSSITTKSDAAFSIIKRSHLVVKKRACFDNMLQVV